MLRRSTRSATRSTTSHSRAPTTPPGSPSVAPISLLSTPVKNSVIRPSKRVHIEKCKECQDTSIDEDFLSNHLKKPYRKADWWSVEDAKPYIDKIKRGGSNSSKLYAPLCAMLNKYSARIHGRCSSLQVHGYTDGPIPSQPSATWAHNGHPISLSGLLRQYPIAPSLQNGPQTGYPCCGRV